MNAPVTVSGWVTETTDASGRRLWRSDAIESCSSGAKLNVLAYGALRMKDSNMANFSTWTT